MPEPISADAQEDADFASGFSTETPPVKTETPEPKTEATPEPKVEAKVEAEAAPKAPKYVQLTQEQFDRLEAAAAKTATIETQMSKAFGTLGDMQQVVKKLQSATPAGASIEIPKDAFADMEKDFPELAAHMRAGLEKSLKGMRGTAPADSPSADPEAVQKTVTEVLLKNEQATLDGDHPTWREIVGAVDKDGKPDPRHPFRAWLMTQTNEYQTRINSTSSPATINRAIDRFIAAKAALPKTPTPAPKVAARTDRIRDAITPRGDGGQPAPVTKDDFAEGFREG
jgi:hypothetical protein